MPPIDPSRLNLLIDWHLDRIGEPERSDAERLIRDDPALRAASDRLGRTLQPLDHWVVAPAPNHLADRVMERVLRTRIDMTPVTHEHRSFRNYLLFPPKEALAVAACIALLLTLVIPSVSALREGSRRALCEGNLASVFRGVSAYQASFGGAVPFAGGDPNASWLPGGAENQRFQSNSRHVFLLIKGAYGPRPGDFVCPSGARGVDGCPDEVRAADDFAQSCNYSYASMNLSGVRPCVKPRSAIPYMADNNPLFLNARFNAGIDPETANSPAHRGKGQTVLTLDGSTRWMTTPIYGVYKDNVWVIGNVRRYTGCESPSCETDVQLVPGYATRSSAAASKR